MNQCGPKQIAKATFMRTHVTDPRLKEDLHAITHSADRKPKSSNRFADPTMTFSEEAEAVLRKVPEDAGFASPGASYARAAFSGMK
jgi:hypothetical protein